MAEGKYSGVVDFTGWIPPVSNMGQVGEELQATFTNGDEGLFTPSEDGLGICLMLQSLGCSNPPEWTVTIEDISNWFDMHDPSEVDAARAFVTELRRVADLVEAKIKSHSVEPKG